MQTNSIYQAALNQQSAVTPARAVNPSLFGTLEGTASQVSQTAARVCSIVDRLCGSAPESGSSGSALPPDNGLLDAAQRQARSIQSDMERISDALARLENNLP